MRNIFLSSVIVGQALVPAYGTDEDFLIKDIQIEGAQRMSKDAVLRDLSVDAGQILHQGDSSKIIHELFSTGYYQDVQVGRSGSTLVISVIERPTIGKFELTGTKADDEVKKILKNNNIAEGRVYDPNVIKRAEKEITNYYLSKQRYGVKVESTTTKQARNRVDLEMRIYEGNVAKIREIKFVGNKAFSDRALKKQLLHKTNGLTAWLDKSNQYSKEKLAAELEILKSFYADRGYLNFAIESTQVSLSSDKKDVYLTVVVSEGPQYYFQDITVSGDFVVSQDELSTIVNEFVKPTEPFSRRKLWEAKDRLQQRLGEAGYSNAVIRIIDDIDDANRKINIKYLIDANKIVTVRQVRFEGNYLTEDLVLRREVEQFEGSPISTKKINEGKEAIMRAGFAKEVEIETIPVSDQEDIVDIVYKLEEQRTAQLSAGISYSGSEGLSYNLGADLKNVAGTGKDVNFVFAKSKTSQVYNFGYSNPYFTESGVGMSYNLYKSNTKLSRTSQIFEYAQDATGGNIGWNFRIAKYDSLRFGFGYDNSEVKLNPSNAPLEAQNFINYYNNDLNFEEYTVTAGWVHNSLDSYLFPKRGIQQSVSFRMSAPMSDIKMYQFDYDFNYFKPIVGEYIFNFKLQLGAADLYREGRFPFYKHYFLGGAETLRGFDEKAVGPKSSFGKPFGGNTVVFSRMQFIFPPPYFKDVKNIRTALFLDAGQVYDTNNKRDVNGDSRNPNGLRYSIGLSFSWNTPLGVPISLSLAQPLRKYDGDSKKAFAFSLGTQVL